MECEYRINPLRVINGFFRFTLIAKQPGNSKFLNIYCFCLMNKINEYLEIFMAKIPFNYLNAMAIFFKSFGSKCGSQALPMCGQIYQNYITFERNKF